MPRHDPAGRLLHWSGLEKQSMSGMGRPLRLMEAGHAAVANSSDACRNGKWLRLCSRSFSINERVWGHAWICLKLIAAWLVGGMNSGEVSGMSRELVRSENIWWHGTRTAWLTGYSQPERTQYTSSIFWGPVFYMLYPAEPSQTLPKLSSLSRNL